MQKSQKTLQYTKAELAALSAIHTELHTAKQPRLPQRYVALAVMLFLLSLSLGLAGFLAPEFFVSNLISPSIDFSETLERNTRIRGLVTCVLALTLPLVHRHRRSTQVLLSIGMVFVLLMTAADLYKLFVLEIFSSTMATTAFLLLRPILIVTLVTMHKDFSAYQRNMEHYELTLMK